MPEKMTNFMLTTILSNRTKEGKINCTIDDGEKKIETQWDVAKAKHIRNMLSEAIEAAISDELIYKFLTTKVGLSDEKATWALLDFRELRQGSKETVNPN